MVEAAVKGGALITANAALEQGIAVFATPGDVHRESAAGCNLLIRDGAHPVLDPADLVAELELILGPAMNAPAPTDWAWTGVTADALAGQRRIPIELAIAELATAEAAGDLIRRGDRFYPRP